MLIIKKLRAGEYGAHDVSGFSTIGIKIGTYVFFSDSVTLLTNYEVHPIRTLQLPFWSGVLIKHLALNKILRKERKILKQQKEQQEKAALQQVMKDLEV